MDSFLEMFAKLAGKPKVPTQEQWDDLKVAFAAYHFRRLDEIAVMVDNLRRSQEGITARLSVAGHDSEDAMRNALEDAKKHGLDSPPEIRRVVKAGLVKSQPKPKVLVPGQRGYQAAAFRAVIKRKPNGTVAEFADVLFREGNLGKTREQLVTHLAAFCSRPGNCIKTNLSSPFRYRLPE